MNMSILDYFRIDSQKSATVAKERLQIIVARQRSNRSDSRALDFFIPKMQQELLDVVKKYVEIDNEQVKMHIEKEGDYEILEVNIPLPEEKLRKLR
ncbi:cell division topological specificity factor [Candidatus Thiomargarita nelsonii]|uniref:Cell division topological specificity factor n=1 Tax=Candidatus Thiomargarita nelsonii TaxID=1003181 RepID=A0A0A6PE57_9GAMM|nr:cell division topological specificity factor [Candidatus Thiomargarita nelsonii]